MKKNFQRTLLVLLLLLSAATLVACGDDDIDLPQYDLLAESEPELAFTLLYDGTYSVSRGDFHLYREIVIPETYNGKPVTAIAPDGFKGCVCEKITIPDSIVEMGSNAFKGCLSLTKITLPKALVAISAGAFENCINLEEIVIPTSVKSIGASAFSGCTSLTSLSLHEGVTTIGSNAFWECKNLTALSLPSTLTAVGRNAFAVLGYDTFVEPDKLTYNELNGDLYLGNAENPYVFLLRLGDRSITSYTVHEGTRVIGASVFSGTPITSITLHDNVKGIGVSAFSSCRSLESIHIPDGVTVIEADTFWGCSALTAITGMRGVTLLGDYAFSSCRSLASLPLSNAITDVGANVFSNTPALPLTVKDGISYIGAVDNPYMILLKATDRTKAQYTIEPGTKFIYQYAFQSCANLTEITVPEGVLKLDSGAFRDCKMLSRVTLPETLTWVGPSAFRNCERLYAPVIPPNVTYIGSSVFSGCNLSKVTLPFVGEYASGAGNTLFGHIFGISEPIKHATKLPTSLIEVVVTNCEILGTSAFSECMSITSITLPKTLKTIDTGAFYFTKNLKKLYINDLAAWCAVDIAGTSAAPMYYNASLYLNGKKLETAAIPDTVTEIKAYTFYGCPTITSLTVPGTVKKVGDSAFEGCKSLASITIDEGTEIIARATFKDCALLYDVSLPDTVTTIDSNAFRGCLALEKISLPKSLVFLADHVFKNCDSLKKVSFRGKRGWYLCESRLLFNAKKVSVWQPRKNAKLLTGDEATLYWARTP